MQYVHCFSINHPTILPHYLIDGRQVTLVIIDRKTAYLPPSNLCASRFPEFFFWEFLSLFNPIYYL